MFQLVAEVLAVENVIAEDQAHRIVADELFADEEGLGQAIWRRLLGIAEMYAELAAITQQVAVLRQVLGGGDQQDFLDAGEHQDRDRVVDHRLVVDRQQLFGHAQRDRVQTRARTTGQHNSLHHAINSLVLMAPNRSP
ncbi:hypothetical protein D3C73_837760 [compost metagenome]